MPELEYITTLTPKQHQALALLAVGQSITAVANTCGLHRTTIHYWKRSSPEFTYALHDACSENADYWRAESQKRAEAALAMIDTFLSDPNTPATVRLKAALHILNAATAGPPKFEYGQKDDPYRAGHQLLAQMRADGAAQDKFIRDSVKARQEAAASPQPNPANNSSQFITSRSVEAKKEAAPAPLSEGKLVSSHFITSNADNDYKVATIRHPHPPTGRNATCPCKSGRKFKHCCLNKQAA